MKQLLIVLLAVSWVLPGCGESAPPSGEGCRPRVVTFSPALTDMVFSMGLGDHVVGVTGYCRLPDGEQREVVGDLNGPNSEKMLLVRPDIIMIQQDPAKFAGIAGRMPNVKIEHFVIEDLADVGRAMERIGGLLGREELGRERREAFQRRLDAVRNRVAGMRRPKVFFLTAFSPLSVAGRDSFIHEMIDIAGGEDLSGQYPRWTQINVERILHDRPEVIICQAHADRSDEARAYLSGLRGVPAAKNGRIFIVTDRRWTIPSPRLAEFTEKLAEMIHPQLLPKKLSQKQGRGPRPSELTPGEAAEAGDSFANRRCRPTKPGGNAAGRSPHPAFEIVSKGESR